MFWQVNVGSATPSLAQHRPPSWGWMGASGLTGGGCAETVTESIKNKRDERIFFSVFFLFSRLNDQQIHSRGKEKYEKE